MTDRRKSDGLYVRTKSVDNTLKPLISHVHSLVNHQTKPKDAGRSKSASELVADVEEAGKRFVSIGKTIAEENIDVRDDMLAACNDIESSGSVMLRAARTYLEDPCSKDKRAVMTEAAKELLSAVTRLLVIADIVDANRVKTVARKVSMRVQEMKQSANESDIITSYRNFMEDMENLSAVTGNRQNDIKDERQAEKLAGARAQLMKYSRMVLTSSRAYVRFPEIASAKANRDFVVAQLCEAIKTISSTVAEESKSKPHPLEKPGVLGLAIEQLKNIALGIKETSRAMAAKQARLQQPEVVTKTLNLLDGKMKCIARESAALCSLDSTRSYRSSKIKHECSGLKEGLQAISETLLNQNSRLSVSEHADRVSSVVDDVIRRTDSLHTQLCRVAVDHVSDLLYDVNVPFCVMADTAKAGSRRNLEDYAKTFQHYCSEIERASSMVCNLSTHPGHVKMVKVAANELKLLSPEAVNAARTVAAQLTSKLARDNLEAYEESWLGQVRLLTCAIDDAVDIDDFLAVTEVHVVEDLKQSMAAVQCADPEGMERAACGVRGRVARLCEVVLGELQLYTNPKYSQYIRGVQQAVSKLQESDVAHFLSCIDNILDQLSENSEALIDEREFLEVATAVRDGIRQVKDAVQSIRADAVANDPDAEIANEDIQPELPPPPPHLLEDTLDTDTRLETEIERIGEAFAESEGLQAGVTTPRPHSRTFIREAEREFDQGELTNLPPEQRQEFQALKEEKQQLESEVDKWGDNTSDLIVVAKDMGMMLVEMSDFTRGAGPLKSTMELIATAKEIADAASAFDKLVRTAVAECPDEKSRGDMLASLEKITFYTHQINITSKVKEDITSITGDSDSPQALENAVTLITTAKNLLNAVVATVKSSYVAYAKTSRGAGNSPNQKLQWRFKTPSKVPLVRLESHQQPSLNRISSGYRYGTLAPIRALEDFRGRSPRFPAEGDEEML